MKKDFYSDLENRLLQYLSKANIHVLNDIGSKNAEIVYELRKNGYLKDKALELAFANSLKEQARNYYKVMQFNNGFIWKPSTVPMPSCLAYAIKENCFSNDELSKIPFDFEENCSSYVDRYYKENLPSNLRKEFLNPKPIRNVVYEEDLHDW